MGEPLWAAQVERIVALLRLFGLVAGVLLILLSDFTHPEMLVLAWATLTVLTVASVPIWFWGWSTGWSSPAIVHVGFALDVLLILGYAVSFAHIQPNVSWAVAFTVLADATMRYGVRGAVLGALLGAGVFVAQARAHLDEFHFQPLFSKETEAK